MKIPKLKVIGLAGIFVGQFLASIVAHFQSLNIRMLALAILAVPAAFVMAAVELWLERQEGDRS